MLTLVRLLAIVLVGQGFGASVGAAQQFALSRAALQFLPGGPPKPQPCFIYTSEPCGQNCVWQECFSSQPLGGWTSCRTEIVICDFEYMSECQIAVVGPLCG